ncbi:MAG: hypothetical protein A2277_20595 [Desulfobacterales bacterium RIFOXYA12_FULL_46_15]|nr:MAG: hypothetical protein A2277_20595 [Desulfobacterales bacterium RIFOXYA12_FULL_46_15]
MKKIFPLFGLFLLISFLTFFSGPALAEQKPEAVLPERVFDFKSVWEGDTVTHDFILKNKGTAPLEVLKVDTD